MRVVVFGASGMIGQGVLRACLLDPDITEVTVVNRRPLGRAHPKLREILHEDFADFSALAGQLAGVDACFFCLGISVTGHDEAAYTRITHDFTLAAARTLAAAHAVGRDPGDTSRLTFTYVSGEGTDSTEKGRTMWARVKGRTENALLALPIDAYLFRAGYIHARHGEVSRTRAYRIGYVLTSWLYPVLRRFAPKHTTTTEHLGRAMIAVARLGGSGPRILYSPDINRLGA